MNAYALDSSSKGSFRTLSCGLFSGAIGAEGSEAKGQGVYVGSGVSD